MNRKVRKASMLVLAVAVALSLLAACGIPTGNNQATSKATAGQTQAAPASTAGKLEPYTIQAFFPGDTPVDFDLVLAEAEKQLGDLNVKLDFQFVPWADYGDKISVKLAAGDGFDLHLNAQWLSINQFIANKSIQAWDPYLDQYGQDVLKAIPQIMLDSNKFDGKIMGIPLGDVLAGPKCLGIRKDLRLKYDMERPDSLDTLEQYLRKVKENEPGVIPLTWTAANCLKGEHTFLNYINAGQNTCAVYVHFDEQGNVKPVKPVYEDEVFLNWCKYAHRWYEEGLIQKDVMAQKDDKGAFFSGKAACAGVEYFEESSLKANVPDGAIEQVYFTGEPGRSKIVSDFKMWNFLCLNSKSKDPVRIARFYNWIFSDQSHYDLLKYGIKDKHWADTGDKTYDRPAELTDNQNYTFPGYVLLDNPTFDRIFAQGSDDYKNDLAFKRDTNNFVPSQLTGFTPNYDGIKNEIAKVSAIWPETVFALGAGILDADTDLPEIKKKLQDAGYDKVVQEIKAQIEAYIAK